MSRKMNLDFTGVENFLRASEGEHIAKISAADVKQSQGGNDMIVVQFEVIKDTDKGAKVFENFPLTETALWKLKGMLQAIGMKADGKVQLDLDRMIGKVCIINVFHEEYDGKTRAKIDSFKRVSAEATEDEADEDEEEEDLPFAEEAEKKSKKAEKAKKPAKEEPINPPADEDDDDWEEDEEEEEKPAPKKEKKAKEEKPAKKESKKSKSDDDDDWDDDDWDE